ncbi:hypothetical protein E2C01_044198 [Portunus trituberculatus]|uniref:Uncharacterized protein n=1 Tax=Portunus trituberculatus TaxID=210409 RepID=A0A5B7FZR4_PORTR|nr:hypothetical protein [Portunus trituberculatus]
MHLTGYPHSVRLVTAASASSLPPRDTRSHATSAGARSSSPYSLGSPWGVVAAREAEAEAGTVMRVLPCVTRQAAASVIRRTALREHEAHIPPCHRLRLLFVVHEAREAWTWCVVQYTAGQLITLPPRRRPG